MSAPKGVRLRYWLWSAFAAAVLIAFAAGAPRLKLQTDILALLPPAAEDAGEARALARFADQLGRQNVFLVGAADFATARAAAQGFAQTLAASPAFAGVQWQVPSDWLQRAAAAYAPYRAGLLAPQTRAWLEAGNDAALLARARAALYTPAAFLRASGAGDDPLDLFGDFLASALPAQGALTLRQNVLTLRAPPPDGKTYVLVRAQLADNAFSTAEEDAAARDLSAAYAAAHRRGATVIGSGLILHAVAAAQLARHEVNLFGGVQLAVLIALLLWVFRSPRMLLGAAATLALGVAAALAVCQRVFGEVHVLTLVFCSNLAGIAVDYSIYYAADQFRTPGRWRAESALPHLGGAIAVSGAVALLSYALLAWAPFPGLRQMALFCCVGLALACASVLAWFPRWLRPAGAAHAETLHAVFVRLAACRERCAMRLPRALWLILAVAVALGLARLRFVDDVSVLQPHLPEPLAQEKQVRALLGSVPDSAFFLVRGADPEAVLENEERLRARLDALQARGALADYRALSRGLPSERTQARDRALLAARVYGADGLLARFMRELGFPPATIAQQQAEFAAQTAPLALDRWIDTPAAEPYRALWLGDIARTRGPPLYASVVTLTGIADAAALRAAAQGFPGVRYVDRVAEVSGVLHRYRRIALAVVAASVPVSLLLFAWPYGWRSAFSLMLAPTAALLATLAVLGLSGVTLSFFNVVALHLVLGLSMEYSLLLRLPRLSGPASLLAVVLAAGLALIAFGLLALSRTPFIHALGSTVAVGVVCGLVLAAALGTMPTGGSAEEAASEP